MTPPKTRFIYLLFIIRTMSSAHLIPVATTTIPECSYLTIEEEGQYNFFIGKDGQTCCLCPIGTHFVGECRLNVPNSTICQQCQYDEKKQTYVDFEPHMEKECHEDKLECFDDQMKIPGSPSSHAKCVCANGKEPENHGFHCDPVVDGGSVLPSVYTQTTGKKVFDIQTSLKPAQDETTTNTQPTDEEPFSTTLPLEVREPSLNMVSKQSSGGENTSASNKASITTIAENSSHSPFERFSLEMGIIAVLLFVAVVLILCFRDKIQSRISKWWQRSGTCCRDRKTIVFHGYDGSAKTLVKGTDETSVYIEYTNNEVSMPLNYAGAIDDNGPGTLGQRNVMCEPLVPAQPMNDLALPDVYVSQRERELLEEAFMEMAKFIAAKDLCQLGRELLSRGREFDDIYYSEKGSGRAEKARLIFVRAMDLHPNLTLELLRDKVKDLGYLCEIIDLKIAPLREAVD